MQLTAVIIASLVTVGFAQQPPIKDTLTWCTKDHEARVCKFDQLEPKCFACLNKVEMSCPGAYDSEEFLDCFCKAPTEKFDSILSCVNSGYTDCWNSASTLTTLSRTCYNRRSKMAPYVCDKNNQKRENKLVWVATEEFCKDVEEPTTSKDPKPPVTTSKAPEPPVTTSKAPEPPVTTSQPPVVTPSGNSTVPVSSTVKPGPTDPDCSTTLKPNKPVDTCVPKTVTVTATVCNNHPGGSVPVPTAGVPPCNGHNCVSTPTSGVNHPNGTSIFPPVVTAGAATSGVNVIAAMAVAGLVASFL